MSTRGDVGQRLKNHGSIARRGETAMVGELDYGRSLGRDAPKAEWARAAMLQEFYINFE